MNKIVDIKNNNINNSVNNDNFHLSRVYLEVPSSNIHNTHNFGEIKSIEISYYVNFLKEAIVISKIKIMN